MSQGTTTLLLVGSGALVLLALRRPATASLTPAQQLALSNSAAQNNGQNQLLGGLGALLGTLSKALGSQKSGSSGGGGSKLGCAASGGSKNPANNKGCQPVTNPDGFCPATCIPSGTVPDGGFAACNPFASNTPLRCTAGVNCNGDGTITICGQIFCASTGTAIQDGPCLPPCFGGGGCFGFGGFCFGGCGF